LQAGHRDISSTTSREPEARAETEQIKVNWRLVNRNVGLVTSLATSLATSLGSSLFGIATSPALAQTSAEAANACRAGLANQIEAITTQPQFRDADWGILVQTLEAQPQILYAQNADQRLIPASNIKLLTTAAALTQLGPDFQIRTSIYQLATAQQTTLRVVGRGDPSFAAPQLQDLARQIAARGIRQIDTLIADDRYFDGVFVNPTWEPEDIQAGYGAPLNSLILNENAIGLTLIPQALGQPLAVQWDNSAEGKDWRVVNQSQTVATTAAEYLDVGRDLNQPVLFVRGQLRVGSAAEPVAVSIPQPTQNFLDQFRQVLAEQQILVRQAEVDNDTNWLGREIGAVLSPRLATLLVETNQQSNNLYAEALLRQLGAGQAAGLSPLAAGINILRQDLTQLGVSPNYLLADGSGLSRQNAASPRVFVDLLEAMAASPHAALFRASLSTAGRSGTLKNRFQNTPVQGQMQGKTGFMTGVASLSGYLQTKTPLVFSILVNQPEGSGFQTAIDRIVILLYGQGSC
jgi:serine-type D-Ala-D-Ala carboxypeptidase/endopeptidase (penicillin-binding protein 4)